MKKITDIEPIKSDYIEIKTKDDLDKIIELPLLESCKIFYDLGITTVMSSCNKRNVELGQYTRRKYTYYTATPITRDWSFGNGFAWILLDYDKLGTQNQEYINSLNNELIELVTIPRISGNHKIDEAIDNNNPYPDNPIYIDFYNKKEPLFTTPYIKRGVLLRYPVNENTTVEEVNNYFTNLASKFSENNRKNIKR